MHRSGAVYVYRGPRMEQVARLRAASPMVDQWFGMSLSAAGGVLAIGSGVGCAVHVLDMW